MMILGSGLLFWGHSVCEKSLSGFNCIFVVTSFCVFRLWQQTIWQIVASNWTAWLHR